MIRIWMILGLALAGVGPSVAQGIRGRVVNGQGEPLEAVSVVLQRRDSLFSFVDAVVTDSAGLFAFTDTVVPCRLVLGRLAYEGRTVDADSLLVGDIRLREAAIGLDEVSVVGDRPLVKAEAGRLSYDVAALTHDQVVSNAYEAIERLPGVSSGKDGLRLDGAPSLRVILNGKPTSMDAAQLEALLRATPVGRVERAEVMYSAPPEYHVRGAVINVVLRRSLAEPFSGEFSADYVNQYYNDGGLGGNFRYESPKVALDLLYKAAMDKSFSKIDLDSRHTLDGQTYEIRDDEEMRSKGWAHQARLALEYRPDDRNQLELAYYGRFEPLNRSEALTTGNYQASRLVKRDDSRLHNVSTRYLSGFGLSLGGDYTCYNMANRQRMSVAYTDGRDVAFGLEGGQRVERYTFFADQKHRLPAGWNLGYGLSYAHARSRDSQVYGEVTGQIAATDLHSDLRERTADLYLSVDKRLRGGSSLSLSATGEYYQMGDYSRWAIYPRLSWLWSIAPGHLFQASLSSDKRYPDYWSMQATVNYLDGYSELHGTPGLRPSSVYALSGTYILRNKYLFTLFFNHQGDYFTQSPYQSTERLALIYKMRNWDYMRQYGLSLTLPLSVGEWYDTRLNLTGFRLRERCDDYFDIPFDRRKWVGVARWDNTFKIGKNLSFEVNGRYQSGAIQGTFDIDPIFCLTLAAQWRFAAGRATLSILCDDLLETGFPVTSVRFKGQDLDMNNAFYNRSLTVRLVYRFGGYKAKEARTVDTSRFGH